MCGKVVFRAAEPGDAAEIAKLLCDSIGQLCGDDHGNDERVLKAWLENKTPETVRQWIEAPQTCIVAAVLDGQIAAVGGLRNDGHVLLNYVAPAFRFQGVSKKMLAELERRAVSAGVRRLSLESTLTAHAFYRSLGYEDRGAAGAKFGLPSFPMFKSIG